MNCPFLGLQIDRERTVSQLSIRYGTVELLETLIRLDQLSAINDFCSELDYAHKLDSSFHCRSNYYQICDFTRNKNFKKFVANSITYLA